MRQAVLIAGLLTTTTTGFSAQKISIGANQNYLFVLAEKPSTLQVALDQAASAGFQVVFGSAQGVYFRRAATNDPPEAYRSVVDNRIQDFERGLNANGVQGFRVIPTTLTRSGNNTVAVMRRSPGGSSPSRYRVVASDDALDKNLSDLASQGFAPIGVFAQQSALAAEFGRPGRLHVVLEAFDGTAVATPSSASGRYRVLSTTRTSTMAMEINQAASGGYRVKDGSLMNVLVEKVEGFSERYSYRLVGATRGTTLLNEIQLAGREGYRVVPSEFMGNPSAKLETVILMERAAGSSRSYEYRLVSPTAEKLSGVLDDFVASGFVPVAFSILAAALERDGLHEDKDYVLLMEKGF